MHRFPETSEKLVAIKRTITDDLKTAIPLRVQNVANYLDMEANRATLNLQRDAPNITPPWPTFFMSYRMPPWKLIEGERIPAAAPGAELGYLFSGDRDETTDNWILRSIVFQDSFARGFDWRVDKEGHLLSPEGEELKEGTISCMFSPIMRWPQLEIVADPQPDFSIFAVPFLAISFCHCKNVSLVCEPIPPKVIAKHARTDGARKPGTRSESNRCAKH